MHIWPFSKEEVKIQEAKHWQLPSFSDVKNKAASGASYIANKAASGVSYVANKTFSYLEAQAKEVKETGKSIGLGQRITGALYLAGAAILGAAACAAFFATAVAGLFLGLALFFESSILFLVIMAAATVIGGGITFKLIENSVKCGLKGACALLIKEKQEEEPKKVIPTWRQWAWSWFSKPSIQNAALQRSH